VLSSKARGEEGGKWGHLELWHLSAQVNVAYNEALLFLEMAKHVPDNRK